MVIAGTSVARTDARNAKITSTTSTTAMPSAISTSSIDWLMNTASSEPIVSSMPAGRLGRISSSWRAHRVRDRDGVGLRLTQHAEADRLAVGAHDGVVVLDAERDGRDIGEPDRIAGDVVDDDAAELGRRWSSRLSVRTVNWRLFDFELARRQLDVVAPERGLDVGDRQVTGRHRARGRARSGWRSGARRRCRPGPRRRASRGGRR